MSQQSVTSVTPAGFNYRSGHAQTNQLTAYVAPRNIFIMSLTYNRTKIYLTDSLQCGGNLPRVSFKRTTCYKNKAGSEEAEHNSLILNRESPIGVSRDIKSWGETSREISAGQGEMRARTVN